MVCGLFAFVLVWALWGSLAKPAFSNDESAYLLQARIFAGGRLVGAARPLPEFFQQYHVFVTPVLAAKYPPGHSLLMVPGVWVGLSGLIPALLVAVTAAALCSILVRFTNAATAILGVCLATTSDIALRFNPSYFSEVSTAALFMVAWWSLLEYERSDKRRWLLLCGGAVAWGGITRPLTMLAFAIPAGIAALVVISRRRAWGDILPALGVAAPILLFMFAWNSRVVGDWRRMPHAEYARLYMPSDRLGFGANPTPPAGHLSDEQQNADRNLRRLHAAYTPGSLRTAAEARAANLLRGSYSYGGLPGLAVLFGAALLPIWFSRVLIATIITVFSSHLAYAHDPEWTLYYLELQAPLALLTAAGVYALSQSLAMSVAKRWRLSENVGRVLRRLSFTIMAACLLVAAARRIEPYRMAHSDRGAYQLQFARAIATLPPSPSIVFVRYAAGHGEERLVENVPDLNAAQTWIVHDCGDDNARLVGLAPTRTPYLYRETMEDGRYMFHLEPLNTSRSDTAPFGPSSTC